MVSLRRLRQRVASELQQQNNDACPSNSNHENDNPMDCHMPIDCEFPESEITSSSEDEDQNEEKIVELDLQSALRSWSIEHNVSILALTSLLKILKSSKKHPDLPIDGRTLLCTPINLASQIKQCGSGEMIYIGIEKNLRRLSTQMKLPSNLNLQFNIDGLPLFKSANSQLWPVLCSTLEVEHRPFVVAAYYGTKKPEDINVYLEPLVEELNFLAIHDLTIDSQNTSIRVHSFVADSPARALILCVKSHSGYHSCTKCLVDGEYVRNRVVFPSTTHLSRNDASFRGKNDEDHHVGDTILSKVFHIDMIRSFPLDYMHLVCLGVTKKLIKLWIEGPPSAFKLNAAKINEISRQLIYFRRFVPTEFARRPRQLTECDRWKATEYRQFLLYTGLFVLQDVIAKPYYDHFIILTVSMCILLSPNITIELRKYAKELLHSFVENFKELYGVQFCSHNIHCLIHLADETENGITLDKVSCFKYESELGRLKKTIRSSKKPLVQLANRISETNNLSVEISNKSPKFSKPHHYSNYHTENFITSHYQKCITPDFTVDVTNNRDSYFNIGGKIVKVLSIAVNHEKNDECAVIGQEVTNYEPIFMYPCNSINIGYVKFQLSSISCVQSFDFADIIAKYFFTARDDCGFLLQLRHF